MDGELRIRARDRPTLGVDDNVGAARIAERNQRVGGEGGLARGRAGTEVVEALAATRRAEDDSEHGEKRECGGEAAHQPDIGNQSPDPRLEGVLRR